MNKLLRSVLLAALAWSAFINTSSAQSPQSGQFNVNINLTAVCTLSAIADVDFAYTSFQVPQSNAANGGFTVACTNQLPYTLGLQAGTAAPSGQGSATIGPITDTVVNLPYTLGLSGGAVPGGTTGSGGIQNYNITGTIAGGLGGNCQTPTAGVCSNAGATNRTHTLIVSW